MVLEAGKLHEFGQRYTAAWCSQKPESVAAFFSPSGWISINGGAPSKGRAAIAEMARGFMSDFPDMQVLMDRVVTQGDGAEFHWTLIGTNTGPGGKGHGVRISGFEAWKFGDDGLIAESLGHFDAAEYQRQIEHGYQESS